MKQILVYGEVLFDLFPNGESVLGGAPFNVAWHLRGFGYEPLFISALGNDELGRRVLELMRDWNLDTSGLYIHPSLPTGRVTVRFENAQPSYEINSNQAYDAVPKDHLKKFLQGRSWNLIYYGSLSLRTAEAKANFFDSVFRTKAQRVVDINLRSPWWEKESALRLLNGASVLKINDEELNLLGNEAQADTKSEAERFLREHSLQALIVTRGSLGALYYDASGCFAETPVIDDGSVPFVDSVGAGDAFCSICLIGVVENWAAQIMLERASSFATKICGLRGATTKDSATYKAEKQKWRDDGKA
jgi:fructokinase